MYILYIVPGDTTVAPLLRPKKGTRTVPFFIQPCGAFYLDDWDKNKSASTFLSLDPGSTCKFVNIYPRPPVASYSNPKDSISSSPAFLYCIMCTCICFMLFRSTCSWPFSEENPLRVASEALNIHLVSCILYLVCYSLCFKVGLLQLFSFPLALTLFL